MREAAVKVERNEPADDYGAALANWTHINASLKALTVEIERRQTASYFATVTDIPERAAHIAREVADLTLEFQRAPLRAAADLEALRGDLQKLRPQHIVAREAYVVARSTEAARIARTLRPRHEDAVTSIIGAIEALAAALKAERDVRDEYASISPEPQSHLLPDVSGDLNECDLARWDSQAARWARRIRELLVNR